MAFVTAVKIIGILVILAGRVLFLAIKRTACYSPLYKRIAPLAFLIVPILVVGVGNYHVFEGSQNLRASRATTPCENGLKKTRQIVRTATDFHIRHRKKDPLFTSRPL